MTAAYVDKSRYPKVDRENRENAIGLVYFISCVPPRLKLQIYCHAQFASRLNKIYT